jgi:Nif-specific regulatory protein
VLENGDFYRVGGTKAIKVDVRHISATNQNLESLIRDGKFREDLYYRLRVVKIDIPPLRKRKEDIPLLVSYFLNLYNKKYNKKVLALSEDVMKLFLEYPWPGNIRELKNLMEGIIAIIEIDREIINIKDIPKEIRYHNNTIREIVLKKDSPIERVEKYEKKLIEDFLHILKYYITRKQISPNYVGEHNKSIKPIEASSNRDTKYKD